jgi:hypothetical protein
MIELPDFLKPYAKVIGATLVAAGTLVAVLRDGAVNGDEPAQLIGAVVLWLSVFYPRNTPAA